MSGYCGRCQKHYRESGFIHDEECEGRDDSIIQGSLRDFENQRTLNRWDDKESEEQWNKHWR